jgi:hypothetical protein
MGVFQMPTDWTTVRYGIVGMDNRGIGAAGVEGEFRLHAPTRLTPYVGLVGDLAFSSEHNGRYRYAYNGTTARRINKITGFGGIAPEAGVSYWVTPTTRLNGGISYYYASGQPDFLFYGMSMEFVLWEKSNDPTDTPNVPRRIGWDPDSPSTYDDRSYFVEPPPDAPAPALLEDDAVNE